MARGQIVPHSKSGHSALSSSHQKTKFLAPPPISVSEFVTSFSFPAFYLKG